MRTDPSQVIVTTEDLESCASVHALYAHHRGFPEVRAEGRSAEDAAARLVDQLSLNLDCAPSDWRREAIRQAIGDVRAFADRTG